MNEIKSLFADKHFEVELSRPMNENTAVIFVHGFGVKRDSRGMFKDIEKELNQSILSARGEFSDVREDKCIALPFSVQQQRLQAITDYLQKQLGIKSFIYIGHSQGCITIGLEQPEHSKILLLAPPVLSPFAEFIKTPGWKNSGSYLDIKSQSRLVRSDLIIDVPPEFWDEFKLIDAENLYNQLSEKNDVTIIFAGADQVLGMQSPPNKIKSYSIADADHDFSSNGREPLLNLITDII